MNQYKVRVNGKEHDVTLLSRAGSKISFSIEGQQYEVEVENAFSTNPKHSQITLAPPALKLTRVSSPTEIRAPMPGLIVDLKVKEGDKINAGQTVCVMEAMKMENNITAQHSATIHKVHVKPKQEVENGALLIELTLI